MTKPQDEFSLPDIDLPFDFTPDLDSFWHDMALDEPDAAELWELTQDEADLLSPEDLAEVLGEPEAAARPDVAGMLAGLGVEVPGNFAVGQQDTPFHHPDSEAAFWFGTLQPDPSENPGHGVAGILALSPDEEGIAADFAPYASGSLADCEAMTAQLIQTAHEQGLAQAFDQANQLSIQHQEADITSPDLDL